jgi:hypothetical protein
MQLALVLRALARPTGDWPAEIGFAADSPLEGDGFEPLVPLHMLTASGPPLVGSVTVPFAKTESLFRDRIPSVRSPLPPPSVPGNRILGPANTGASLFLSSTRDH